MKHYNIRFTSSPSLDWSAAEVLTDFTLPWEQRHAPLTEFRALWDETHLHFRFHCVDEDIVLPDGPTPKDRVLGSDRVEIFFAPDLGLKPYYCLEMSPRGDVLAYEARFYRDMNWDWQCDGLQIDAKIEGGRYTVTGSLPLDTLRALNVFKSGSSEIITGLYRAEFHHRADGTVHSGWMPWVNPQTERPDFHVPASFGVLSLSQR
ncbi:carbohydrate-binding family 9-like protein [Prosthecobacter sp.]|uniref:carbohydrate-binding family 9-like protein n=1 Tax=Prosthecobacter sp. TaxID=1965333 RepID=UPI003784B9D3